MGVLSTAVCCASTRCGEARRCPVSARQVTIRSVRVAVVAGPDGSCWLSELAEDGTSHGPVVRHDDFPAAVTAHDHGDVRWVWPATAAIYPALLRAGVRVGRCHGAALTAPLLRGRAGRLAAPALLDRARGRQQWAGG